jgi:hypothetical protein
MSGIAAPADGRVCVRCLTLFPPYLVEHAFRRGGGHGARYASSAHRRNRVCRACEQTARDQRKIVNRWPTKARDTIRRHAVRLGIPKDELIGRFGWDAARLAHDAEFQYRNGCNYCTELYAGMGHGLADITLDVQDPEKPPYYLTNTKWCCQTCNRKKGRMNPDDFEADRHMWELRRQSLDRVPEDKGMLF